MRPTFRQRLLAARGLWEKLLALRDGLATEADALLGVEDRALPDKAFDATGTAIDLIESDLVDDLGTVLPWNLVSFEQLVGCFSAGMTDLRRALICSIFSGRSSAKRSFRVCCTNVSSDLQGPRQH
jgi:hypothetical protein